MTTPNTKTMRRGVLAAAAVMASASGSYADRESFLADVKSDEPQKQLAAWKIAEKQEAGVIAPLAKLLVSDKMSVQKCAAQSLMKIVHSVGKEKESGTRKAVTNQLLLLLKDESPVVKTFALRALSLTANADSIPYIAPLLTNKELEEEAAFCLERIPDQEAVAALIEGLGKVDDDFKPRVIAALGHLKAEEAATVLGSYMQSANLDIAMAAVKAVGRIGVDPDAEPPAFDRLNDRQKKDMLDSALRYADMQIAKGKYDFARKIIGTILIDEEDVEEHYICAAIVSASRMDSSEAAAAIVKQLNRPLYIVRDTACKALVSMKGSGVEPVLKEAEANADGELKKTLQDILRQRKA